MKKFINLFVAMTLGVAATFSLAACGGDDEPDAPDAEKTVKEAKIATSLYVNQAMLDTYDIVGKSFLGQELKFGATPVDITFSDGQVIPMYAMELEGTSNAVPFISVMTVSFTIKDGYKVPEKSDFAIAVDAIGTISYSDGENLTLTEKGIRQHNTGVFGEKIDGYTELLNKNYGRVKVTLESDNISLETGVEE